MGEISQIQKSRKRFQVFSWSGAFLVFGVFAALNFILSFLPLRLDTSDGQVYSISRGSKEILKKLDDKLIVKVAFSSQLPPVYKLNEKYVSDLLSEYKRASGGKIRIEYLDPGKSPEAKQEAMSIGVAPVQLDVRERDRREVKECFMGVGFIYGDKHDSIPVVQDPDNLEYEISSRIKKLLNPEKAKVGLVKSGDALTASSKSLETLANPLYQLYDIEEVDLTKPVSPTLKALWLIGPSKSLQPEEITNLRAYAFSGGTLGLLLNRNSIKLDQFRASPLVTGLDGFLDEWGLKMRDGLVVDPRCDRIQIQTVQGAFRMVNVIDYPYFPWISDLDRKHPATKNIDGVAMQFPSPIEISMKKPGFNYTSIAQSSEFSFLDTRPSNLSPMEQKRQPSDAPSGPFTVGMLVEGKFDQAQGVGGVAKPSRLILLGTSHFIESEFPARPSNYNLFVNLMDWSVQDEALIQIRSKGVSRRPLKESSDGIRLLLKYLMVLTLPFASLVAGLVVWRRQKIRRALLPLVYREA